MDCSHNDHQQGSAGPSTSPAADGRGSVYTCPMHPEIEQDTPGMCPECGMNLVSRAQPAGSGQPQGHSQPGSHSTDMFLKKFWVVLVLTVPLVAYSELTELFFGWAAPRFAQWELIMLLLGTVVFFYGGWVFLSGAYYELRGRLPGMMTLIAIAIVAAYAWSVYATFTPDSTLFWELSTLITIMLLGHWIEMRSVKRARGALQVLAQLLPETAAVIRNGSMVTVSVQELSIGDMAVVKPGGRVPADGEVAEGSSEVNESIVTGESRPVGKEPGSEVIGGTINGDGSLKVRITKVGEDSFLANVMRLVKEAEQSKSHLQLFSDRAAFWLTVVAVSVGVITLVVWLLVGAEVSLAVARLVAVLVIACPHALGLAVPLSASISTNMAAAQGFIIKRRLALEVARSVDTVLFDKTGTLTKGEFGVEAVLAGSGFDQATALSLAASINSYSEHSLGRAIVQAAKERGVDYSPVTDFERLPGKGARGEVSGRVVLVGSEVLLHEKDLTLDVKQQEIIKELEAEGKTVVYVISEQQLAGAIALADIIRPESKEAVTLLHQQGRQVAMITGDSEPVAAWVASQLGIDEHFARVRPEQKVEKVKELQSRGQKVAMVGDGVNDAPALTQADVGIAIGAGTNVAIESAGIILVRNNPLDIPKITRLSRLTYRKMIQNLFWAAGYNVVALPLAAGALVYWGVPAVDPAVGAIFMSASTVIVAFNALLLKRAKL